MNVQIVAMGSTVKMNLLIEYKDLFDDVPLTITNYLTGIDRETMLLVCCFLLASGEKSDDRGNYQAYLTNFFSDGNTEFRTQVIDKISRIVKEKGPIQIISRLTMLQLFEFAFDHLNSDKTTQTKEELERNVFKAILFQNSVNLKNQEIAFKSTAQLDRNQLAAMMLSQSYPYSELSNHSLIHVLTAQIIKSVYLFEFLAERDDTKGLLKEFCDVSDCKNWQEYLKRHIPLILPVAKKSREAHTDILIKQDDEYEVNCRFLDRLTVADLDPIEDYDFTKVRAAPLYRVMEGQYRIVFDLFVVETLHKGLFFKLAELNKKLPAGTGVKGNFRSFYCDNFSEKALLYSLMQDIYGKKYIKYSGAEILARGIIGEPDYYIRNGNRLFLFESKDILINKTVKGSFDFAQYEPEFIKKLYKDIKPNGSIEKKAVLQLLVNIERAIRMQFTFDQGYKPKRLKIYPILILHDHSFNVSGLNKIINGWFTDELSQLSLQGLDISGVRPITIIDIDTLLVYQDPLRLKNITLEQLIDDYHYAIDTDRKRKIKSEEEGKQIIMDSLMPFSVFVEKNVRISSAPRMLMEKGIRIFSDDNGEI